MKTLTIEADRKNLWKVNAFIDEELEKTGCPMLTQTTIDTILRLKSYHLWASFPSWRCFNPVNAAVLRLPPFSLARSKNPSKI